MENNHNETAVINILQTLKFLLKNSWKIIVITILFLVIYFVYANNSVVDTYSTTTAFAANLVSEGDENFDTMTTYALFQENIVYYSNTNELHGLVAEEVNKQGLEMAVAKSSYSLRGIDDSSFFELTTIGTNPEEVKKLNDIVLEVLNKGFRNSTDFATDFTIAIVDESFIPSQVNNPNEMKEIVFFGAFVGLTIGILLFTLLSFKEQGVFKFK